MLNPNILSRGRGYRIGKLGSYMGWKLEIPEPPVIDGCPNLSPFNCQGINSQDQVPIGIDNQDDSLAVTLHLLRSQLQSHCISTFIGQTFKNSALEFFWLERRRI